MGLSPDSWRPSINWWKLPPYFDSLHPVKAGQALTGEGLQLIDRGIKPTSGVIHSIDESVHLVGGSYTWIGDFKFQFGGGHN